MNAADQVKERAGRFLPSCTGAANAEGGKRRLTDVLPALPHHRLAPTPAAAAAAGPAASNSGDGVSCQVDVISLVTLSNRNPSLWTAGFVLVPSGTICRMGANLSEESQRKLKDFDRLQPPVCQLAGGRVDRLDLHSYGKVPVVPFFVPYFLFTLIFCFPSYILYFVYINALEILFRIYELLTHLYIYIYAYIGTPNEISVSILHLSSFEGNQVYSSTGI